MKKLIIAVLIAANQIGYAQTEMDALRYSQLGFMTTARQTSMGGAFGALGSDISTLSTNPAGIAINSKSLISLNLGFNLNTVEASHYYSLNTEGKFSVNVPNIGLIINLDGIISDQNWTHVNIGYSRNNLMKINSNSFISGMNNESTLGDYMLYLAEGFDYENELGAYADLAFRAFLIDTLPGQRDSYYSTTPNAGGKQQLEIKESSSILENAFSVGGTYQDRLSIGATLGLTSLKYSYTSQYKEHFDQDSKNAAHDVVFDDNFTTTGSGIHLKLGVIFKPINWLRLGASIHTPTYYYNMEDDQYIGMDVIMDDGTPFGAESNYNYSYTLKTPSRQSASIAFILNKVAILSFEADHTNYGKARFNNLFVGDYKFETENQNISEFYTNALRYKTGLEYRIGNSSLRGGVFYQESSYANPNLNDDSSLGYSAGFGMTKNRYRLDFAYGFRNQKTETYMYGNDLVDASKISSDNHNFMIGWTYLLE